MVPVPCTRFVPTTRPPYPSRAPQDAIRFQPLPEALVRLLVETRLDEIATTGH